MHVSKQDIEVKLEMPGVVMRQHKNFGSARGYDMLSGEYFSLAAGVDTAPLFKGLEGDLCQSPHWGFVLDGRITTTDPYGFEETVSAHDLFYWPPGHNVRVDEDAELVMFSPQHEHTQVITHMINKVAGN